MYNVNQHKPDHRSILVKGGQIPTIAEWVDFSCYRSGSFDEYNIIEQTFAIQFS
jgi:hypothetical protein